MPHELPASHRSKTVRDEPTDSPNGVKPTKLTKRVVEGLKPGQLVRDTAERGFFAEAGKTGVSFKIQRDVWQGGRRVRTVRMTIGRFPQLSVDEARNRARDLLVQLEKGIDLRPAAPAAPPPPRWT